MTDIQLTDLSKPFAVAYELTRNGSEASSAYTCSIANEGILGSRIEALSAKHDLADVGSSTVTARANAVRAAFESSFNALTQSEQTQSAADGLAHNDDVLRACRLPGAPWAIEVKRVHMK